MTNTFEAIHKFFHPQSIAIVGASKDLTKVGGRPIDRLLKQGYKGKIYPINPNYDEIAGLKAYASVLDVKDGIDLAILAMPAKMIKQSIEDCAKKGIMAAVVFSAGFAETGEEGKRLQLEMIETANRLGVRLLGPNCLGVANLLNHTPISFVGSFTKPDLLTGEIGFVSQSGAVGSNLLDYAQVDGIGFNYWATTGNEADLGLLDFVSYFIERPDVQAVGCYIEAIKDGQYFRRVAERARELKKPIVCLKVGTSDAGKSAVSSHTGSLAGADAVYDAVFRQYHVIRVKNRIELLDTLKLAVDHNKPKSKRIGIMTASGGNGIMMADYAAECGFEIVPTAEETKRKIMEIIPPFGSPNNPIDFTPQGVYNADNFKRLLQAVVEDKQFDVILLTVTAAFEQFLEYIRQTLDQTDKLVCLVETSPVGPKMLEKIRALKIPFFTDYYRCIKAVSNLINYQENVSELNHPEPDGKPELVEPIQAELPLNNSLLGEWELKSILKSFVPVPEGGVAHTADEAVQMAQTIGYPVVMKVNSRQIAHKTDVGGVKINLRNDAEVETAFNEIVSNVSANVPNATIDGVLIERFINEKGIEVVVGFNRDPVFGHSLTFGLGGVFVEVIRDVSTRVLPVSRREMKEMIREIKGWPMLDGFREKVTYDIDELENVMVKLAKFVERNADRIEEFEINPLKVLPKGKGAYILDSLLKLQ